MDSPFVYDRFVTGKNFLGRKMDCTILSNLLVAGEQVMMYGRPKSGKMSIVQQTLFNMRLSGRQFMVAHTSLSNVRTLEQFLLKLGTSVIKSVSSTAEEYSSIVSRHLEETHFVFDRARFASHGEVVSMNWTPDMNDVAQMLRLSQRIAQEQGKSYYVILEDFHNVLHMDEYEEVFKEMNKLFSERDYSAQVTASYLFLGSHVPLTGIITYRLADLFHKRQ